MKPDNKIGVYIDKDCVIQGFVSQPQKDIAKS